MARFAIDIRFTIGIKFTTHARYHTKLTSPYTNPRPTLISYIDINARSVHIPHLGNHSGSVWLDSPLGCKNFAETTCDSPTFFSILHLQTSPLFFSVLHLKNYTFY